LKLCELKVHRTGVVSRYHDVWASNPGKLQQPLNLWCIKRCVHSMQSF